MSIKRLYEFFDDEDLKSQFEIPHLQGVLDDDIRSWKTFSEPVENEDSNSFYKKVLFRYPVLKYFHEDIKTISGDNNVYCFYATSKKPSINDNIYYAQLVISFNTGDKQYYVNIVLRDVNDYENQSKWKRYDLVLSEIDKVYGLINSFLDSCVNLDIISTQNKMTLNSN